VRPEVNLTETPDAGVAASDSGENESSPPDVLGEPALKATLFGVGPSFAMIDRPRAQQGPGKSTFVGPAPAAGDKLFSTPSLKSTLMGPTPVAAAPKVSPPSIKSTLMGPATPLPPSIASVASAELPVDTVFANAFKVVRTLARGRTSTLYEAALQGVGKRYALKVLRRAPGVDEQALQRFVHDARVASRVESAHLVEVTRAGFDGASECPWIAMELLEGETLAARLERLEAGAAPPADEAWRVLTGVCRGLAKAHHQGVAHGDLRPSNVFLSNATDGPSEVKLVDFGVAQLFEAWRDDGGAEAATWRAPELPSRDVTPAADVWSLGLLAFLLFTGRSYWEGTSPASPLDLRVVPASARAEALGRAALLPRGFDAWFAQCVSRTPAARFASARELGAALATVQPVPHPEHVLDYTPSRGASTASSPPAARKVTTRPSTAPSASLDGAERPSRSAFATPAARPPAPRAPRSPIHAPLTQADAPPSAPPRSAVITQSAVRAATPSGSPAPLYGARAPSPPGNASPAAGVRISTPGFPSVMPGARASSPPNTPSPANGVRVSAPAFPTPMNGMPPAASGLSLSSSVTGSGSHRAATTTGSHRAATPSGSHRAATPSGSHRAATTTGSHRAATTTGSQRTLTTSGAQSSLTASGAQRALSSQYAQAALGAHPMPLVATPFAQRPTAPPPPLPTPQHTKMLVMMGFVLGSLASLALALFVVARRDTSAQTSVGEVAVAQPEPAAPAAPAALSGAAHRWNGTLATDDAQWSFVLSLRVSGTAATGWFSWRAVSVPGARPGVQVRENVEGDYDPATGAFELHGTATTNPSLLPVNAYRLRGSPDGALVGTALDASSRIEATPEARGGR
jgi:serine/threonine protein kinase